MDIAALLIDEGAGIEGNSGEGLGTRGYDPVCHAVAFGPCSLLRKMLDLLLEYRTTQPVQLIHIAVAISCISRVNLLLDHNEKVRRLFYDKSKGKRCSTQFQGLLKTMPEEEIVEPMEGDTNLVNLVPEAAINVAVDGTKIKWDWRLDDESTIRTKGRWRSATPLHIAAS